MNRREIKITAKEAAKQAGKAAKLVTLVYLLCQLGLNGLQLLTNFLTSRTSGGGSISDALAADARNKAIVYIIMVIVGIVGVLLSIGYTRISLQVHRREPVRMDSLLEGFQIPGRVIGLRLLRALLMLMWTYAILIPAIILLSIPITPLDRMTESDTWFVMYLVVLLIVAVAVSTAVSYRYWGATFILLDHPDYTVRECIRAATEMTRGHRMELFLLDLSLLPWNLLCILSAGILYIWKMPYIAAVYAGAYEELDRQYQKKKQRPPELRQQFPTPQHPPEQT